MTFDEIGFPPGPGCEAFLIPRCDALVHLGVALWVGVLYTMGHLTDRSVGRFLWRIP